MFNLAYLWTFCLYEFFQSINAYKNISIQGSYTSLRNYNFTSYIEEILTFILLIQHILKPLKLGTYNSMYLKMRM